MINREGTEEKLSSAVTSPCGPAGDRESDGGDDLSHYSSCGGESEFERYCSASSAMGTPSYRNSSFQDSDFGSWKSFKLGGENTDFKSLGPERVLSGYRKSECCDEEKDNGMSNLSGRMEGFVVGDVNLRANLDVDGDWGNEAVIDNEKRGNNEGNLRITDDMGNRELEIDRCEDRNISDEGEASSRCEHSEGEDSMFGFGSDEDRKIDLYYEKNVPFRGVESRIKENQLVMNSAVAFGSDDWDDFVQESSVDAIGLMSWGESQAKRPISSSSFTAGDSVVNPDLVLDVRKDNVRSTSTACNQVEDGGLADKNVNARSEVAKGVLQSSNEVSDIDELVEYLGNSSVHNIFQTDKDPLKKPAAANEEIKIGETESEMKNEDVSASEIISIHQGVAFQKGDLEETNIEFNPLSDSVINHSDLVPLKGKETKLFEDNSSSELPLLAATDRSATTKNDFSSSFDQIENHFVPFKVLFLSKLWLMLISQ